MADFQGTSGPDIYNGTPSDDNALGDAGNDVLHGAGGNDALFGEDGNDVLYGDDGNDALFGGDGNDILDGGLGTNRLQGGAGNDIYTVSSDADTIIEVAGEGYDAIQLIGGGVTLSANADVELIVGYVACSVAGSSIANDIILMQGGNARGLAGDDLLQAIGSAPATLDGGDGNDLILGGIGSDILIGGRGDDILYGAYLNSTGINNPDTFLPGGGNDYVEGGPGRDSVSYADAPAGVVAHLGENYASDGFGGTDTLINIDGVTGSNSNDVLIGTAGYNALAGGNGNDILDGRGGGDELFGGAGNDVMVVYGMDDRVFETSGNDLVIAYGDFDLSLSGANTGVETLAAYGNAIRLTGDEGANIIVGNESDNILSGAGGNDILQGYGGTDTLLGGNGNDRLEGGDGDDILIGGAGLNQLVGGNGSDTASYAAAFEAVAVRLDQGLATDNGFGVTDTYSSIENVTGSTFADTIFGDNGANILDGRGGADVLNGGGASDVLIGGGGNDMLTGGSGTDQFRFGTGGGVDTITDFATGVDQIALDGTQFTHSATIDFISGAGPSAPTSTNSTFIYDTTTGALSYDADGIGAGAAVTFATLGTNVPIVANDLAFF